MDASLREALLAHLTQNGPVILAVAVGWWVSEQACSLLLDYILPTRSAHDRSDLNSRANGFIHGLLSCALALMALWESDSPILQDHVFGTSTTAKAVLTMSSGYFMWDVYAVIRDQASFGFVLHGVLCLVAYSSSLFPFIQYYGCIFLMYELSTPFLNLRFLLIASKMTDTLLFTIINALFASLFFFSRIIFGFYFSYQFWREMLPMASTGAVPYNIATIFYFVANICLNTLNVIWLSVIVRNALRDRTSEQQEQQAESGKKK